MCERLGLRCTLRSCLILLTLVARGPSQESQVWIKWPVQGRQRALHGVSRNIRSQVHHGDASSASCQLDDHWCGLGGSFVLVPSELLSTRALSPSHAVVSTVKAPCLSLHLFYSLLVTIVLAKRLNASAEGLTVTAQNHCRCFGGGSKLYLRNSRSTAKHRTGLSRDSGR